MKNSIKWAIAITTGLGAYAVGSALTPRLPVAAENQVLEFLQQNDQGRWKMSVDVYSRQCQFHKEGQALTISQNAAANAPKLILTMKLPPESGFNSTQFKIKASQGASVAIAKNPPAKLEIGEIFARNWNAWFQWRSHRVMTNTEIAAITAYAETLRDSCDASLAKHVSKQAASNPS